MNEKIKTAKWEKPDKFVLPNSFKIKTKLFCRKNIILIQQIFAKGLRKKKGRSLRTKALLHSRSHPFFIFNLIQTFQAVRREREREREIVCVSVCKRERVFSEPTKWMCDDQPPTPLHPPREHFASIMEKNFAETAWLAFRCKRVIFWAFIHFLGGYFFKLCHETAYTDVCMHVVACCMK